MRPPKISSLIIAATLSFLLLITCKKDWHPPYKGPENYRIVKMRCNQPNCPDSIVITYNSKHNPIMLQRGLLQTYRFRYNAKDQLTDFFYVKPPGTFFWQWDRFTYDHKGRAISDTVFVSGYITDDGPVLPPGSAGHADSMRIRMICTFEYDTKDRLIVARERMAGRTNIYQYKYGPEGNRDSVIAYWYFDNQPEYEGYLPTGYVYDPRGFSLETTHRVWRLINRDYSINSQEMYPPVEYNDAKLPVKISTNSNVDLFFATLSYLDVDVTYERNN